MRVVLHYSNGIVVLKVFLLARSRLAFFLLYIYFLLTPCVYSTCATAASIEYARQYPIYIGLLTGYGDTDWERLVSQDEATAEATPISATGTGLLYGFFGGYQPFEYVAFEAEYIHFPDSELTFEPGNASGFEDTTSKTDYYALLMKLLVPVTDSWRVFGDIGVAHVTRSDDIADISDTRATFGFGADYSLAAHWFVTMAFEYTPGTGEAEQDASAKYIPYVYSGQIGLAYRF